jgi:mRNA interferase MazF
MKRGDVYQTDLNPTVGSEQAGVRPAIIVSRDAINASSPVVVIVPLTSRSNKKVIYPSQVEMRMNEAGLTSDSVVLCEQVRAISRTKLKKHLGHVTSQRMAEINAALKIALDLP